MSMPIFLSKSLSQCHCLNVNVTVPMSITQTECQCHYSIILFSLSASVSHVHHFMFSVVLRVAHHFHLSRVIRLTHSLLHGLGGKKSFLLQFQSISRRCPYWTDPSYLCRSGFPLPPRDYKNVPACRKRVPHDSGPEGSDGYA